MVHYGVESIVIILNILAMWILWLGLVYVITNVIGKKLDIIINLMKEGKINKLIKSMKRNDNR